jgi:RimJ/RimL family protein N-acetyltransferase
MPLTGENILLREEREDDLPFLLELRNDLDTQGWSRTLPPHYTEPMYRSRFEGREFTFDPVEGRFVIETLKDSKRVGTISYTGLEPRWEAIIGIAIQRDFWGKGVAHEAQELLLHFLFVELGLRVVRLWTQSGNPRAVRLAERSGFQIAFQEREAIFKAGRLYDNLMMDLIREEYFAYHPELEDHLPPIP